jgi:hypothetical protein
MTNICFRFLKPTRLTSTRSLHSLPRTWPCRHYRAIEASMTGSMRIPGDILALDSTADLTYMDEETADRLATGRPAFARAATLGGMWIALPQRAGAAESPLDILRSAAVRMRNQERTTQPRCGSSERAESPVAGTTFKSAGTMAARMSGRRRTEPSSRMSRTASLPITCCTVAH